MPPRKIVIGQLARTETWGFVAFYLLLFPVLIMFPAPFLFNKLTLMKEFEVKKVTRNM